MKRGFTLIELLVVISIIGMLAAIVLVSLNNARVQGVKGAALEFAATNYHAFGNGAIAIWNFDESSNPVNSFAVGGPGAADSSFNNRTLYANTYHTTNYTLTRDVGKDPAGQGNSLRLSSSVNGYGVTNTLTGTDLTPSTMTESLWVNLSSVSSGSVMLEAVTTSSNLPVAIFVNTSPIQFGCDSDLFSPALTIQSGPTISLNQWHLITCSVNETSGLLTEYVDGDQTKQQGGTLVTNPYTNYGPIQYIAVGADVASDVVCDTSFCNSNGPLFSGDLDDISIYSQALADSQIHQMYAEGAPKHGIALK